MASIRAGRNTAGTAGGAPVARRGGRRRGLRSGHALRRPPARDPAIEDDGARPPCSARNGAAARLRRKRSSRATRRGAVQAGRSGAARARSGAAAQGGVGLPRRGGAACRPGGAGVAVVAAGPRRAVARTSVRRSAAASAAGDARAAERATSSPPRSHNRPSRKA